MKSRTRFSQWLWEADRVKSKAKLPTGRLWLLRLDVTIPPSARAWTTLNPSKADTMLFGLASPIRTAYLTLENRRATPER